MEKPTILSWGEQENYQNTIMTKNNTMDSQNFPFTQKKASEEEEVKDSICLFVFKHFVVSPCSSILSPISDAGKRKT